jgi:2-polyprenyl-3-methyl-5-hydroxy-6-metoxy-1,4-benzoquinol methylase
MNKFSRTKLNEVASNSLYTRFAASATIEYSFQVFSRFLKKGTILELGPAEGLMTKKLLEFDKNLYVIEGSNIFADKLKKEYPAINVINNLFEEVKLNLQFDNIVLGHVLEHVENPVELLKIVKQWLKNDGIVLCAVPNARSLHRQAAVHMGLMKTIFTLSDKDRHHGHMRLYTPETLLTDFLESNFEIIHSGGYWLKPISDIQIESTWTREMLYAFMKLGEFYPDIAAEIYVIAK